MKNKKIFQLLFLQAVAVGAILIYIFVDSADIYRLFMGDTKFTHASKECDLKAGSCGVDIPKLGRVTFDIEPKHIPLMETLTFSVKTESDFNIDRLKLNIYATNMNMGYHQFKLKKISPNHYEAKGVLPTCAMGGMIWNAEVVKDNKGAIFTFKTK
jgi:hypothetical protein